MGCWSASIMGGDTPYDAHGWVWDRALALGGHTDKDYSWVLDGEDSPFNHDQEILRECLTPENIECMYNELPEKWDPAVYAQVLALVIIESGAAFPEALRPKFIALIAVDEWAQEDDERAGYVLDLIRRIQLYVDGDKQEVPSRGLFDTMFNSAEQGMAGVILSADELENAKLTLDAITRGD